MSEATMTTVAQWREFLQQWSEEWLQLDEPLPAAVRKSRWMGFAPCTAETIDKLENRLGYSLPPSYRAFLLTTNGWRATTPLIKRLRPAKSIEWLEVEEPERIEVYEGVQSQVEEFEAIEPEEYFAYDGTPGFDEKHLHHTLKIADPVEGDSLIYLLNPLVVAENGEWEAWRHAAWIPGAERFPSFSHLMVAEHAYFRAEAFGDTPGTTIVGPFQGVYAPDRPRHPAPRIGPGKRRPRMLSVEELVADLESPSASVRKKAADRLYRQFNTYEAERPELAARCVRILRSPAEPRVRGAAASVLGRYGNRDFIEPLLTALTDPHIDVAGWASTALLTLSSSYRDRRIADGLCRLLDGELNRYVVNDALTILDDFGDERLPAIGLKLLDSDVDSQLRYKVAFAAARGGDEMTDALIQHLNNVNPEIRAAAAAALREAGDPRALGPLRELVNDVDPAVVQQAVTSIRFLETPELIEIARSKKIHMRGGSSPQ